VPERGPRDVPSATSVQARAENDSLA
jgi:hypothetical protein